jgi:flagellar protein FliJ
MLRSQRLEPVLDVVSEGERRAARALGSGEARLTEAQRKLAELERYEQEYRTSLRTRTAEGIDVVQLRAFHGFIARLGEAIVQQAAQVRRAQEERDGLRAVWLQATQRARAVGKVVEHAVADERQQRERREQADFDERAQRGFAAADRARRDQHAGDAHCEET